MGCEVCLNMTLHMVHYLLTITKININRDKIERVSLDENKLKDSIGIQE